MTDDDLDFENRPRTEGSQRLRALLRGHEPTANYLQHLPFDPVVPCDTCGEPAWLLVNATRKYFCQEHDPWDPAEWFAATTRTPETHEPEKRRHMLDCPSCYAAFTLGKQYASESLDEIIGLYYRPVVRAAIDLRAAQGAYMADRGDEAKGQVVGVRAAWLDIALSELKQYEAEH